MKHTRHPLLSAALVALALASLPGSPAHAGEAEIRKNLAASIPRLAKLDEVRKAPIPGLYELRVGFDVFYTDENGSFIIQGSMIDVKNRRKLTEERVNELSAVKFDELPLKDAFKIVRGNGKRQMAVFADPNCGYCRHFEKDALGLTDVTIHLFLFPILGPDSQVKARDIWCAKDKAATWNAWMVGGTKPATSDCDTAALRRNVAFGTKYNITGTPTLFFADGSRAPGAVPAARVEKMLTAAAK